MPSASDFTSQLRQRLRFDDAPRPADWRQLLGLLSVPSDQCFPRLDFLTPPDHQFEYALIFLATKVQDALCLTFNRIKNATGRVTAIEPYFISDRAAMAGSFSPVDLALVEALRGHARLLNEQWVIEVLGLDSSFFLTDLLANGRIYHKSAAQEIQPLLPSDQQSRYLLRLENSSTPGSWRLRVIPLAKDESSAPSNSLMAAEEVFSCGWQIAADTLMKLENSQLGVIVAALARVSSVQVPIEDLEAVVSLLANKFGCQRFLEAPDPINYCIGTFVPTLYLKTDLDGIMRRPSVSAMISFRYGEQEYPASVLGEEPRRGGTGQFLRCEVVQQAEQAQITVFERDLDAERAASDFLKSQSGVAFSFRKAGFRIFSASILQLVYDLLEQHWRIWAENLEVKVWRDFEFHAAANGHWFDLELRDGSGRSALTTWQIFVMLKRNTLFVPLGSDAIGVLPEAWYHRLCAFYDTVKESSDDARISLMHALALDGLNPEIDDDKLAKIREGLRNIHGIAPLAASPDFKAILRPYQEVGLAWLRFLHQHCFGGLLADDMGLGKTVQVLAFLDILRHETPRADAAPSCHLLIAPRTLLPVWQTEAKRLAPKLRCKIVMRSDVPQLGQLAKNYDVLFASYDFVRVQVEAFQQIKFDVIVCDEAQFIKNPTTQVSRSLRTLNGNARFTLTGTPIENRLEDLFSLFDFINPRFVPDGVRRPCVTADGNREQRDDSLRRMRPFILRRTKADVLLDLPEKTESLVLLPMTAGQRQLYGQIHEYFVDKLRDRQVGQVQLNSDFLEGLLRLRQAACHPGILDNQLTDGVHSSKLKFVLLKAAELAAMRRKAVVFSQFTSFLKLLRHDLATAGVAFEYLDGETQDRDVVLDSFRTNPDISFLLASTRIGGTGINLSEAEYCFILDPWWNLAVERQAVDRIHRIGQKQATTVYRLISEGTVEEKMLELQERKSEIAGMLAASDDEFLQGLSPEDFGLK